jgi:DNA-binding GntR family transcriptional regulator
MNARPQRPSHGVYLSKGDMVTGALRELLMAGEYEPGQSLPQRELAQRFGVSSTPVREALRRLETEGLVRYDPHRGSSVVEVDWRPTRENYRIRAELESLGVELAAQNITEEDLDEIEALAAEMEAERDDRDRVRELNSQLHFRIYEAAKSPLLISLLRRLWQSFPQGPQVMRPVEESIAQHRELIEALREGDAGRARKVMHSHVMDALEYFAED